MVKKLENEDEIKEIKISTFRMVLKILKLFLFSLIRMRWYVPGVSEITVDELNDRINSNQSPIIIDVRDRIDFYAAEGSYRKYGHIPNAKSIPIMHLSANLKELSSFKEREIVKICPGGGMSLISAEIMVKAGFTDVKSLKGGMDQWDRKGYPTTTDIDPNYPLDEFEPTFSKGKVKAKDGKQTLDAKFIGEIHKTVDARNLSCPKPVLMSKKALGKLDIGQVLEILATDPGSKKDIPAWAHVTSQELISVEENDSKEFRFLVRRLE